MQFHLYFSQPLGNQDSEMGGMARLGFDLSLGLQIAPRTHIKSLGEVKAQLTVFCSSENIPTLKPA